MRSRVAESDSDLQAYVDTWNAVSPGDPSTVELQRKRRDRDPRRLCLLAEEGDALVGCGFAGPSDSPGRGFLSPQVLPHARRRGNGSGLLRELATHLDSLGFTSASTHVDGEDEGSLAFAAVHGFEETDRQVEQVRVIGGEPRPEVPAAVSFVTLSEAPHLLRDSYPLAVEAYADMAVSVPVTISLDDWLDGDGAGVPAGSFFAVADGEVIGLSGLCAAADGGFEDGLTTVRRGWRRRGIAEALKRAKLAWAAGNGVTEIVTWTQRGNDGMRALNERLGYTYRSVSITLRAPLPLRSV